MKYIILNGIFAVVLWKHEKKVGKGKRICLYKKSYEKLDILHISKSNFFTLHNKQIK